MPKKEAGGEQGPYSGATTDSIYTQQDKRSGLCFVVHLAPSPSQERRCLIVLERYTPSGVHFVGKRWIGLAPTSSTKGSTPSSEER